MFLHMIPIPRHARFCLKWKKLTKGISKISGYHGVREAAVCVGCGEAKVSLAKLDQDRDKAKSHQWQRRSHETATGKRRQQCLRVEERAVAVWGYIRRNEGRFSSQPMCSCRDSSYGSQLPSGRRWWSALFFVSRRSPAIRTGYFNAYLIPLFKMTNFSPAVPDFWALALYAHNFSFFSWL